MLVMMGILMNKLTGATTIQVNLVPTLQYSTYVTTSTSDWGLQKSDGCSDLGHDAACLHILNKIPNKILNLCFWFL